MHWRRFKIFSRTTGATSTLFDTNYLEESLFKERPHPFFKGGQLQPACTFIIFVPACLYLGNVSGVGDVAKGPCVEIS